MKAGQSNGACKILAEKITDLSLYTVKETVGKSFPLLIHEVKLSEGVRKEYGRGRQCTDRGAFSM